jgi:poly(A) polymerase
MEVTANWLENTNLQTIMWVLGSKNTFAVGGCVRDTLVGRKVNDVDLTTALTPTEVKERLETIPGAVLYPTGLDHGTWTVMIDNDQYEVTTFRKDVETDGRRATVAYAKTMEEDALRRDFTMNALYMDMYGTVYDPTGGGLRDLYAGSVRFVGNADARCQEDYLRILRLFRFHAQLGADTIDAEAFAAAETNAAGLKKVSGERKWAEFKKILSAPDPYNAVMNMELTGVLQEIVSEKYGLTDLRHVISAEREFGSAAKWERRYAALTGCAPIEFPCSKGEQQYIADLAKYKNESPEFAAYMTKRADVAIDCHIIRCAGERRLCMGINVAAYVGMKCPVNADAFIKLGAAPGAALGQMLKRADAMFVASGYKATQADIMEQMFGP